MDKRADVLTSKIVQVSDSHNEDHFCSWLLCEDGSLWLYNANFRDFRQVHPPHEPPAQSTEPNLSEALKVLRNLYRCLDFGQNEDESRQAFDDAYALLKKHGA